MKKYCATITLILLCISITYSQTNDSPFYYLIRVSQTFSPWSNCLSTNDKPKEKSSDFYLIEKPDDAENNNCLYNKIGQYYYYTLPKDDCKYHLTEDTDTIRYGQQQYYPKIKNALIVDNMNYNDEYESYFFILKKKQIVRGGDKANCSWINPNHEGYDIVTTIELDDPVDIEYENSTTNGHNVDNPLTIRFNDYNVYHQTICNLFYKMTKDDNINSEGWKQIDNPHVGTISPNGSIKLYYSDIVGAKKFDDYLGRSIDLCVGKRMFDGKIQYGKSIAINFTKTVPERPCEILVSSCYKYLKIRKEDDGEIIQIKKETEYGNGTYPSVAIFYNKKEFEKYKNCISTEYVYFDITSNLFCEENGEKTKNIPEGKVALLTKDDYDLIKKDDEKYYGYYEDGYYYIDISTYENPKKLSFKIGHNTTTSEAYSALEMSIDIPSILEPIKVVQNENSKTSTSPLNPFAILDITDDIDPKYPRTPYNFYKKSGDALYDRTNFFKADYQDLPEFDENYKDRVKNLIANGGTIEKFNIKDWWNEFYKSQKKDWITNNYLKAKQINQYDEKEWAQCTARQSSASVAIMPKYENTTYLIFGEPRGFNEYDVGVFAVENVEDGYAQNWHESYKSEIQYSLGEYNEYLQYAGDGTMFPCYWEKIMSNVSQSGFSEGSLAVYRYENKNGAGYSGIQIPFKTNPDKKYDNTHYKYVTGNGCKMLVKNFDNGEWKYYEVCTNGTMASHGRNILNKKEIKDFVTGVYNEGCSDWDGRDWEVYYYDNSGKQKVDDFWEEYESHHCELTYYNGSNIIYQSSDPDYNNTTIQCSNVKTLLYVGKDELSHYVQYEKTDGKYYQKRFFAEDDEEDDVTPDEATVNRWYNAFYYKVYQYEISTLGNRLYGVTLNQQEQYILEDAHGCKTEPFDVLVTGDAFSKIDSVFPTKIDSKDGKMIIKYNGGNHTYHYGDKKIEKKQEHTIENLGIFGSIQLYDENNTPISIPYNFGIGIERVKGSFCNTTSKGTIIIETKIKTDKSFILKDRNGNVIKRYPSETGKYTIDEDHTFTELEEGVYTPAIEFKNTTTNNTIVLEWGTDINLNNSIFSIDNLSTTDAKEINGTGKIEGTVKNAMDKLIWTIKKENKEIKSGRNIDISVGNLGAGSYTVSLEDDYCTYEESKSIVAPQISCEVKIINAGSTATMKVIKLNAVANASCPELVLKKGNTEISKNKDGLWTINPNTNYEVILSYYNNDLNKKEVCIAKFNISQEKVTCDEANYSFNYDFVQETINPVCQGDLIKHIIKPQSENATIEIPNVIFDKETDTFYTDIEELTYTLTDTKLFEKPDLGVKLYFSSSSSATLNGTLIKPFSADHIYIDNFMCYESDNTTLHIEGLTGGNNNKSILYGFDGKSWTIIPQGNNGMYNISIINDHNNADENGQMYNYKLYMKNDGCNIQDMKEMGYSFNRPSKLSVELITDDIIHPTCEGTATGSIPVVACGGTLSDDYNGYCYFIDKNDEDAKSLICDESEYPKYSVPHGLSKQFDNLIAGDHIVSVYDNNLCKAEITGHLLSYYNPRVISATDDWAKCYGYSDGSINVDEIKGTSSIKQFQLLDVRGDTLQILNANDELLQNAINTDDENDFEWDIKNQKGERIPFISFGSLKSGYYNLALTDEKGCSTNYTGLTDNQWLNVYVHQPDSLIMSIIHQDTIIHEYGKKGGSVEVLVTGGNKGRFNIYIDSIVSDSMVGHAAWDIHETFKDIFMPDTTHKLYVQDHKECTDSVITGFMRQPDSPLMVEGIPHPAWCNGAEGSIKIIAKGGWGKYRYSCNLTGDTVAMRQPFDSVAASLTSDSIQVGGGLYVLTLIDSAGVMVYDTVLVTTPPALKADNLSRAAYCGSDGVIAVDISGGTAPYKIENDFGQETFRTAGGITAFSKSVPAGSYTVYIKDTNDCRFNVPVSIADSSVVVSIKRQYPTMRQYANGRLEAVAQRGHAPYTFLWTNRNTGETCANAVWNNVMAGTYSLVVSDGSGCEKEGEIAYLATNGDLPLTIDAVEGETAPNAKNGWARFTSDTSGFSKMMLHSALGGDIDVIGNISNQLNFELTGLAPDSYVLECMLPEGEVRYAEFTIAKYEPIVLLVNNINHASQPDASDGSATLQITGGVAPYVVQMLHNDVFYDDTVLNGRQLVLPQLSAGTYAAIVIDKYGKRENTRFIIKEPDSPMQLTAESVQSPSCYGYSNGQIWLKAQGGWGDYEYALAGSDYSRTTMYGNRSAESYTFIAIDAKGVTDTLTVELSQPEPLRAGVAKVDSVSCFGLFDGGVTFDITGGTAPYYVEFDSLFTKPGNYIGSLNGGLHTFRFTDDKMCASDDDGLEVDVPQPEKLVIANDSVTPTTCNTDNGKIDIVIAGGIAPYTVKWKEDGLTVARLQGRTSIDSLQQLSLYSVVAVDANNCETEDRSYRMNRSSGPRINKVLTLPVLCYGDATGTAVIDSADITTAVPFAPFRIEWPNGQNAMSVNDLTAGAHLVTIVDTNNCVNSTRFEVGSPNPVEIKMIGSRNATCYGYTDGLISTLTLGGVGSYHYLWNTGDTLPDLDSIGKGSYTIVATDFNNCHDTATFSIGQPDSLHVEIGEESVLMCPGNTYEFIATSGFKTYCWVLNDSILSEKSSFIASDGGEYYLEATYGANCISRDTVTISIGDDLLEADFYMASDAAVDTALALVELSNMQIDSLHWEFSPTDFVVMDSADYELYLKPLKIGQHEITLWAYSGGCVSYITKQVEISELADTASNINLGYNPLIKSVDVMPNPTKGRFSIRVKLREDYNAEVSVSSAGQGKPVERRELSGKSEYEESFDLSNAGDGVYILRIVAGSEQRVAKVLITK